MRISKHKIKSTLLNNIVTNGQVIIISYGGAHVLITVFSRSRAHPALDMRLIANILLALWKLISQHSNRHRSNHNQYQSNHHPQSNYIHHENMHHGYATPLRPACTNRMIKVWVGKMRMCTMDMLLH